MEASSQRREVRDLSWDDGEQLSAIQHALRPSIDRIEQWAQDHPALFAGVWLDNAGFLDGTGPVRVGVGFSGEDAELVLAMLEPLMDDPALLVLERKGLPLALLRDVQDRLVRDYLRRTPSPVAGVTGCGVDVSANAVSVMLAEPDDELERALRNEVAGVPLILEYGCLSLGHGLAGEGLLKRDDQQ